jgi:mannose-1-phosphate guanylyltransferase
MFIKVTTAGGRRYAHLVESFRNESGQPRQRTIATLGHLDAGGQVDRLIAAHEASGLPVTLALRSHGVAKHIALDGDRAIDIRGMLGRAEGTHVFSGIYCFNPDLFGLIPAGEKVSVIPAFLELAKQGRLGAVVLDEGDWRDLGDPATVVLTERWTAPPSAPLGYG